MTHLFHTIIYLLILLVFSGCQGFTRKPSSVEYEGDFRYSEAYRALLNQERKKEEIHLKKMEPVHSPPSKGTQGRRHKIADKNKKIDQLERELSLYESEFESKTLAISREASEGNEPYRSFGTIKDLWRFSGDLLVLHDLKSLSENREKKFYLSLSSANEYELKIENYIFSNKTDPQPHREIEQPGSRIKKKEAYLEARLSCDVPFTIKRFLSHKKYKAFQKASFKIFDNEWSSEELKLIPSLDVKRCILEYRNPFVDDSTWSLLNLEPEPKILLSNGISAHGAFEICHLPQSRGLNKRQKFFLNRNYLALTCPESLDSLRELSDATEAVISKVEALLGYRLTPEDIERKDPYMPLDFTQAPKLDVVFVSYLVFRSDFYGSLIARLLKFHAERGTRVKILVSEVIQLEKDKTLLFGLANTNPNIQLQEFRYDAPRGAGLREKLSEFHKTMHVKLMITYSAENPDWNRFFIGGRNIHDGFLFTAAPDHSPFPRLVNYAKGEESFVHWRDFEVEVRSHSVTEQMVIHFLQLWERDSDTQFVRPVNLNIPISMEVSKSYFKDNKRLTRHFLSVPYKDNKLLEDFFVDLIDSAEKTLHLSTPYFRPTQKLGDALKRAVNRGVDVTLLTRINLEGDVADIILSDVNKAGINQFLNQIKIYEWIEPKVILHTKMLVVDDELSFVGSVNLNKRSFVHDMESGLLIYDIDYAKKMGSMLEAYQKKSQLVTKRQKIKFWKKFLINVLDEEF